MLIVLIVINSPKSGCENPMLKISNLFSNKATPFFLELLGKIDVLF